jgi:hypothetical protein
MKPGDFFYFKDKMPKSNFDDALVASKMILAMPGLGYDTYRSFRHAEFHPKSVTTNPNSTPNLSS